LPRPYDAVMSDDLPPDDFGGMAFLNDLMRLVQAQAGGNNEIVRQLAHSTASEGRSEPNIDPVDRIAVEELVRIAELHVTSTTGLSVGSSGVSVEVGNRSQWADRTINDYRPLFEHLSSALVAGMGQPTDEVSPTDPMAAMMANLSHLMGPIMLGMMTGSMVGHLARRAFGGYDLPVPRPTGEPVLVLLPNVDDFGRDWSIASDDLRLWVCLHEVTHQAVFSVDHVHRRLTDLLERYASAFDTDPERIGRQFGGFDLTAGPDALAGLQETLSDPDVLLGAVRSPEQEAIQPELTALVAAITGYVDWVMDSIGETLIGSYSMITEALRRRRVEAAAGDRFVARILGLELNAEQYDRGTAFTAGVLERAGTDGLNRLFADPQALPTPAEIDAPGLWLARIDLPS
jgi:putative hydrolase